MSDEKIASIETALAHQDLQIQDLSEMINLQWKEIERLKLAFSKTQDKLHEIENAGDTAPGSEKSVAEIAAAEKPPHY